MNSTGNKLNTLASEIRRKIDIVMVPETKIDGSLPSTLLIQNAKN